MCGRYYDSEPMQKIVINNVNHNERIYSITKWPRLCRRLSFSSVFYWLRLLLIINNLDIPRTLRNEVITTVQSVCTPEMSDCYTSLHEKAENFPGCLSIIYQMRFSQKIFYWKFQLNLPTNRPETREPLWKVFMTYEMYCKMTHVFLISSEILIFLKLVNALDFKIITLMI